MKPKKYAAVKTETTKTAENAGATGTAKTAGAAGAGIKVNAGDGESAAADTKTANGKS